jgi:hypothetical protein
MNLKARTEALTSLLLIVSGVFGLLIALADFVGLADKLELKLSIPLILVTVGMLAVSVGLERVIRFRNLDKQLNKFEKLFASHLGCRYYEGHDESYKAAIELCATAEKHVRTLIIGRTAPEQWAMAVSDRLQQTKNLNKPVKFQATLAYNFNNINPPFIQAMKRRLEIYSEKGVDHLMTLRFLDVNRPLGFDLLIIDHQHLFIGVPSVADEKFLTRAIVFNHQERLVDELVDWYDQVLVRGALTFPELEGRVSGDCPG